MPSASKIPKTSKVKTCPPGAICFDAQSLLLGVSVFIIIGLCVYIGRMWYTSQNASNATRFGHTAVGTAATQSTSTINPPPTPPAPQTPATTTTSIVREIEVVQPSVTNIIQTRDRGSGLSVYESNMLRPPLRQSPDSASLSVGLMPINIETRGTTPDVQQVGILSNSNNDTILALYGRPTYRGSSKWMYYTGTDKFHSIKLPVSKSGRDCTGDYGCEELYDGDSVHVKGYDGTFGVSIYGLDAPRYIPYIV